ERRSRQHAAGGGARPGAGRGPGRGGQPAARPQRDPRAARVHRPVRADRGLLAAVGLLPHRRQPRHDDPPRRHQRAAGDRHAAGHPHGRHRPLGRLHRRAGGRGRRRADRGPHDRLPRRRAVSAGLGGRAHRAGHRRRRGRVQRDAGHPLRRGAVHRDPGNPLHGPRRRAADLQRRDVPEPRRQRGARQHGVRVPRRRPDPLHPGVDLADGAVRRRGDHPDPQDAVRALGVCDRRQRARRRAGRHPGQQGPAPRLHDVGRLRRDVGPDHRLRADFGGAPGRRDVRAQRHRGGRDRRHVAHGRPRQRARRAHRRLRDRLPRRRPGHRRRLDVLADRDQGRGHRPRGDPRSEPAAHPAPRRGGGRRRPGLRATTHLTDTGGRM
ncbi:MAG: Ribose ABC transport system, permease protein RbsC, partial [uncultured Solirubrobacteraceae bacterium]